MPLRHSSDDEPGISRERDGDGFRYRRSNGSTVRDEKTLARIRALAIPPAYERVWICADANGHLQATGLDARGRKQYRYHPEFRESRERAKFGKMLRFAKALPRIRAALDRDLKRPKPDREKALATVVSLLEKSLVRVGNEEYARENGSVGLTTMRMRHAALDGSELRFRFKGKSGVRHDVALSDRRLANAVRKVSDLPGQRLFQYVGEDGAVHPVTSEGLNEYLKEISGGPFTAKDFRTWAATVGALEHLAAISPWPTTKRDRRRELMGCFREMASRLGNTPSVCRTSYVHPAVVEAFESGALARTIRPGEDPALAVARLLQKAQ